MKNLIIKINSDDELKYPFQGYILGVQNFSICFGKSYTLNEIRNIKQEFPDKKIFVSLNRVIFQDELDNYKKTLIELDKLNLDGIIVGDIAALTYGLKTNIILDQLHLNNSYLTVKHYTNNNVNGIVLTNDITMDDINKIKEENPSSILFKQVFGLVHLSSSTRNLVTNYLKYFNKEHKSKVYIIKEEKQDDFYYVYEDYFGSHILNAKPINLLKYIEELNVDYFVFDTFLLDDFKYALDAYLNYDIKKSLLIDEKYNANTGFINKKTIYKVKNNE